MAGIRQFEDIEAWRKARALAAAVYGLTLDGPCVRDFGLRDQIRRAAVSVMANIAEGFERAGDREFHQFLRVAKGSCGELRSHLWVALDQGYLSAAQHREASQRAIEISRMLAGLMRHLRESGRPGERPTWVRHPRAPLPG